jgi:predicted CXXCH cytochrome family protein
MLRPLKWSVLLALFLVSCTMQQLLWPERPAPVAYTYTYHNPHVDCVHCHGTANPGPDSPQFAADPSSLCFDCHDYKENHHPVDFRPTGGSEFALPVYNGIVRCLTCHEIHGGPNHKGSPKLLRGGPYPDRRTICSKCHSLDRNRSINPHIMLESDGAVRKVNGQPVCLLCHAVKPDPEVDRTPDVKFKADIGFLCWRCHPPMPGTFFDKHFLVTPSPKTQQNIQEAEERLLVILPLVPRGRITCSTCHNPHQRGVIQHEAAAKGADTMMKLRLPSICFACHRM